MALITLTLGGFTFQGMEVPESMPFGVAQALTVHTLIGGAKVVDAMGRDDAPVGWGGWFMGADAMTRALQLKGMVVVGQQIVLTWGQVRYLVQIQNVDLRFDFVSKIHYDIVCVVVADQSSAVANGSQTSIDDQMGQDMASANGYGSLIGDGPLSSLLGTLGTAITTVSSFANAAQSTIASVLAPIAAVQSRVGLLLTSAVNTSQNVTTFGGLLPGNPVSQMVSGLGRQSAALQSQPSLMSLQNIMGRMVGNLGSVSGNSTTHTVAGGNLMTMAQQAYGDATSWTSIAKANKLTDPVLTGVQTIIVPVQPDTNGGLLGA